MSMEEMAEMAYLVLKDIGYSSDREWFNKRIFLAPNNDAFFSIFQFLLNFADSRTYEEKFKFCLPLYDKRREADFRKSLCSYLQELASNGELVDVPPIKMALFTTPGRKAFLQVLMAVIEWALRKQSSELGIILPPYDAPEETVQDALNFFTKQGEADRAMMEELDREMQSQMELLVSDLAETERAVQRSRDELTKAREETKTTEDDEVNLRKFSGAVMEIAAISRSLQKVLEIAKHDAPSRDATVMMDSLPETSFHAVPETLALVNELNEQLSGGAVDIVLYMKLIKCFLRERRPMYNDVIEKLSQGSSIDQILSEQRKALRRAKDASNRFRELIEDVTESISEGVRSDLEAVGDVLIRAIDPPPLDVLDELVELSEADLESTAADGAVRARAESMLPPSKTNIRRKRIGDLIPPAAMQRTAPLSVPSPLVTPIPRIESLRKERIKRRSIKEVFSSTPLARPQ